MIQEFFKTIIAWPAYVVAFIVVGFLLLRAGEILDDVWHFIKHLGKKDD